MDPTATVTTLPTDTVAAPAGMTETPIIDLLEDYYSPNAELCDVILVTRDYMGKVTKIRASRAVLGSASKVFRALFSERYAEGQALLAGAKELKVEDPRHALLTMCQLLHHLPLDTWDEIDDHDVAAAIVKDWSDLAVIIDKYDCVEPLRLQLQTLLRTFMAQYSALNGYLGTTSPLVVCAAAAYLLDQPEVFREATSRLIKFRREPSKFRGYFEAQRAYHADHFARLISDSIDDFSTAAYEADKASLGIEFMDNCREVGLWPLGHTVAPKDVIRGLRMLKVPAIYADEHRPPAGRPSYPMMVHPAQFQAWQPVTVVGDGRPAPPQDDVSTAEASVPELTRPPTFATIIEAAKKFESNCIGLCLDCLKKNEVCRVPHPYVDLGENTRYKMCSWGYKFEKPS
ncbi:hypothetical protein LTR95_000927 [Oleoguttula sp. CCFEE 5521]